MDLSGRPKTRGIESPASRCRAPRPVFAAPAAIKYRVKTPRTATADQTLHRFGIFGFSTKIRILQLAAANTGMANVQQTADSNSTAAATAPLTELLKICVFSSSVS